MSDDYDSKKRRNSKGRGNNYKTGKGVKVYFEVKQTDSRTYDSEKNYDRNDGGYQQRQNNGHNRQNDNNYYKNNNNYQNNKFSKRDQQVYKKKDEADDRYDQERNFDKDFPPMGSDSQGYGKEYQNYGNSGSRAYNMQYENYSNSGNKPDTRGFSNNQKNYGNSYTEKETRTFVRWDEGGSEDIFNTIDMKSVDAELRGRKTGGQASEKPKNGTKQYETGEDRRIDYNALLLAEKDEKPIEWDNSEEQGEFSNVDLIFEQKLKQNLVAYEVDDCDDLLAPQGGKNDKLNANNDDEDEAPEWGDVDVSDVKKATDTMESVFFKGSDKGSRSGDKSSHSQSLSSTFDSSQNSYSNSSRFEKVFGMSSNEDISSIDPRAGGLKNPSMHQQQPTLEQQQEYMRQMQMKSFGMGGNMQFMPNGNPMMQMNGNKLPQQNQVYNPYFYYQQQQILQHQQINAMQTQHILAQTQNKQNLPPNLNKTQPPLKVFEKFSGPNYGKKLWYYIDRSGKRQGPFTGEEMDEWYKGGFLPGDLVITFGENNGFRQLQELVKKVEESMKPTTTTTPPPSFNKLNPNMPNLANLTSFQLCELMKNPDFIQNAQKAGYDLNRVMYSLLEREQNEKQNKTTRTSTAVITGTFDSQGVYYPVNNPEYTMRYLNSQSPSKDGAEDQQATQTTDPEYMKQGIPQNYQQQMQYMYMNQGNLTTQNPVNSTNQNQTSVNQDQNNGAAPSDQLTSQLKSLLGVDGGLGDLMGISSNSNKTEQGKGANINPYDFPSLGDANK